MEKLLKLKDFILVLMHDIWKIMQKRLKMVVDHLIKEKIFIQKIPFALAN